MKRGEDPESLQVGIYFGMKSENLESAFYYAMTTPESSVWAENYVRTNLLWWAEDVHIMFFRRDWSLTEVEDEEDEEVVGWWAMFSGVCLFHLDDLSGLDIFHFRETISREMDMGTATIGHVSVKVSPPRKCLRSRFVYQNRQYSHRNWQRSPTIVFGAIELNLQDRFR